MSFSNRKHIYAHFFAINFLSKTEYVPAQTH